MRSARMRLISRRLASCVLWPMSRPRSTVVPRKSGPFSSGMSPYFLYFLPLLLNCSFVFVGMDERSGRDDHDIACFLTSGNEEGDEKVNAHDDECFFSNGFSYFIFTLCS